MTVRTRLLTRNRRCIAGVLCALALIAVFAAGASARGAVGPDRVPRGPSGVPMPVGNLPGWKQVFKDDFAGSSLDSKWQKYNGIVGGGQGGWWARSHVVVHGGELVLETYHDPVGCTNATICPLFNDEVSGGVKSKFAMTYGKFLVRFRTRPIANDSFMAILWPESNIAPPETDFAVVGGPLHLTSIGAMLKYGRPTTVVSDSLTANAAQWHTLGVIWSPGEVEYTIDGHVWATDKNANVSSVPMHIVLQSQTVCEAVPGQTCTTPWTATEPNVDIAWVVAYRHT